MTAHAPILRGLPARTVATCLQHRAGMTAFGLLTGADWALAHGDVETVAHLTQLLAARAEGPLRRDALAVAQLFLLDVDRAARRWPLVRAQLWEELAVSERPSPPCTSSCTGPGTRCADR